MSGIDDIIKKILALKPTLTREAVNRLIEEERAKAAGLLTEEAAAHLVASNLGVNGTSEKMEAKLRIGDLTSGLNDISLTGRVVHVFPSRTFNRRDGREGKVARIILGDMTGSVVVVFWDEKADLLSVSKVKTGKIIRILHGYTRERRGKIEINIGNRGQVFLEPMDAVEEDFPGIEVFFITPGDVHTTGEVNLEGVVVDRFPGSTFTRSDGSEGKVSRLVLEEGGGRVNLVLWDDKVEQYGDLPDNTRIRVIAGSARESQIGGFEVHLGWQSEVQILEKGVKPAEPVPFWINIGDLKEGMNRVNIKARVYQVGDEREFTRRDGSVGRVANVLIQDITGITRLTLWDDDVNNLDELKPNIPIVVENGYTRSGLGGVELHIGRLGELRIDPVDVNIPDVSQEERVINIMNLTQGQRNITIQGQLLDDPVTREVETSRGTTTVTSFRLDDETGETRVSLWREVGDMVKELMAGAEIRLENINVSEPFDGLMQVSSGTFTKIKILKR